MPRSTRVTARTSAGWRTSSSSWSNQGLRYYKGLAWYRQTLDVPKEFVDQRVFLWCGGVDEKAKVWVNGKLVAEHEGGDDAEGDGVGERVGQPGEPADGDPRGEEGEHGHRHPRRQRPEPVLEPLGGPSPDRNREREQHPGDGRVHT